MNGARTARQRSPPTAPEGIPGSSDLLSNPSYDIITEDVGRFTTQYYHTVEPSEGVLSPKDGGGSSSDSSSSGRSKTSSTSSDDGGHHHRKREVNSPTSEDVQSSLPPTLEYVVPSSQQKVAMSMCGGVSGQGGGGEGSSVKHWSYEEQFKQVNTCKTLSLSLFLLPAQSLLTKALQCVAKNWLKSLYLSLSLSLLLLPVQSLLTKASQCVVKNWLKF